MNFWNHSVQILCYRVILELKCACHSIFGSVNYTTNFSAAFPCFLFIGCMSISYWLVLFWQSSYFPVKEVVDIWHLLLCIIHSICVKVSNKRIHNDVENAPTQKHKPVRRLLQVPLRAYLTLSIWEITAANRSNFGSRVDQSGAKNLCFFLNVLIWLSFFLSQHVHTST